MKLSTKGRYAVTAMMDLALREAAGPVALADISERQGISLSYLEQLFASLRRGGLVVGMRGPGGGYRLARSSAEITVADVVVAVDANADSARPGGQRHGLGASHCLTHDLWRDLSEQIHGFLDGITLVELAHRPQVRAAALTSGSDNPA